MNQSKIKWLPVAALVILFAGAIWKSYAAPTTVAIPALQLKPPQPKITWSPSSVELTISPGENISKEFIFTSDSNFQNGTLEVVPELASLINIQPSSFANVVADQSQTVRLNFIIPSSTPLGVYEGTIHLRLGAQTSPQTLKVKISTPLAVELYRRSMPPQMVYALSVSPLFLTVRVSTSVTATADIGNGNVGIGPTIIPTSVSLLRYSSDDRLITNFGQMYDDSTHGDVKANDGKYSLRVPILDTTARTTYLTVSVRYSGLVTPVFSKPSFMTTTVSRPSPEQILETIANALDANDMTTVRSNVYQNNQNVRLLQSLGSDDRNDMAQVLRSAKLKSNDGTIAIFLSSDGSPIRLARSNNGAWQLVNW